MSRLTPLALAQRLPDLPRLVEIRDLLLTGLGELFGVEEQPAISFALREVETATVFIVGAPSEAAILAALRADQPEASVIAPPEQAERLVALLPTWKQSRILLHRLAHPHRLPPIRADEVGILDPSTLAQLAIPTDLLQEIENRTALSPVVAAYAGKQPVAFCYAGALTESLWDIAIDTLEPYRRRGHAAHCVTYLIHHMHAQGKQPVWQAADDNPASWRLAQKIGFEPMDELALFENTGVG